MPRVSVVVNSFNYGRYLRQALDSVLAQDYPAAERELIVVDDGSTDDSRAVIDSYGDRLVKVYQANHGQAGALNSGFERARGEIVCLLDSDDWWAPSKVSRVVARFDAEPRLGLVQHWCEEVTASGPLPAVAPNVPPVYSLDDFLAGRTYFTGTTGLSFRREVAQKVLPIPRELFYCADEFLYTHAIFHAPVGTIPEVLAWRRVHGANMYAGVLSDPRRLENHLKVRRVMAELMDTELRSRGLCFSAEAVRRSREEELREELLLSRYRGRLGQAFGSWKQARGPFKRATLALALVSPRLYLVFQALYVRLRMTMSGKSASVKGS